MANINEYLNDGANWQAQAVLAYMKGNIIRVEDFVKYENKDKNLSYRARVGRYENCREQGYVFSIQIGYGNERHYAVYEHRNSDILCVLISDGLWILLMWTLCGKIGAKTHQSTTITKGLAMGK